MFIEFFICSLFQILTLKSSQSENWNQIIYKEY